jgi:hypothetical protein
MKVLPMNLRLASGSVTPARPFRNSALGVDVDQRDVVVAAEQADDLLRLAQPHQAVIDEDAGQLLADRLVDQHGGNRAVDPAGQAADHLAVTHLLADFGDLGLAELGHGPVAVRPQTWRTKFFSSLRAIGRVDHFGVELHGVDARFIVGDDGEGRAGAGRDGAEAGGRARSPCRRGSSRPGGFSPSAHRPSNSTQLSACR